DLGRVRAVTRTGDTRFEFETAYDTGQIEIGASICCSGACMTVIDKGPGWFAISASDESLSCTTMGDWREGSPVNFERSLRMGDEMGGHIVSGHVDGVGEVVSVTPENESVRFQFRVPDSIKKYIAPKCSVAIDGVSMTVNEVEGAIFGVNVIPHTQEVTTLGHLVVGSRVNLEIDMLARYVARLLEEE
ncbi:MAG: riboflavin synthase, partial [Rhodospirillales bacterium]|nr:riboflavin synthase [Rhodospirillales bacterium]